MFTSRTNAHTPNSAYIASDRLSLKSRVASALAPIVLLVASPSYAAATEAQSAKSDYDNARLIAPLLCADFERRADGSWLPERPFSIEGIYRGTKFRSTHGINTVIRKGAAIEGIDLGALLEQQCAKS
ncbi:MAG: hypothetical protein ABSD74_17390 [Rhizomicrobium sp.]|jgi:hypothetical protein